MKLLHQRHLVPNFGYDLNVHLWNALVPGIFNHSDRVGFLGSGPLIGQVFDDVERVHVLSSGVGAVPVSLPSVDTIIWGVRGPVTGKLLNLDASRIVTDAAILAPLVWPAATPRQKVVVIPHMLSLHGCNAFWHEACAIAGFKLVNPMQSVEAVLNEISSASLVLSECVYGAILADAYGVPWKAWGSNSIFPLIEWMDWAGSMQLPLHVSGVAAPTSNIIARLGRSHVPKGMCDQLIDDKALECAITKTSALTSICLNAPYPSNSVQKRLPGSDVIGSHILGYRPSETAKHLFSVASTARPFLSDEDHRARCRHKIMDLLGAVLASEGRDIEISGLRHLSARSA